MGYEHELRFMLYKEEQSLLLYSRKLCFLLIHVKPQLHIVFYPKLGIKRLRLQL